MTTLGISRRVHSTKAKGKEVQSSRHDHDHRDHDHDHDHGHERGGHSHSHSHSHSILGSLSHTHGPDDVHTRDAEKMVEALKGGGDRGSRITLIGLVANVGLTVSKGTAGWYMNSAALLADAGHSLSDLLGDFVTLFCWKLSRRPPSARYPYGFGKFEVLGTTTVSLLLTGGALGIGFHSWGLLSDAISQTAGSVSPGLLHDLLQNLSHVTHAVPVVVSEHDAHAHAHALDPNAAWFAAVSVIAKEWLYRITKRVADDERSPVLLANAVHHRSDAYSSMVALVAILGTWWMPQIPLDPIGGLLVSILIFRQGWDILMGAFRQLTDASVSRPTHDALVEALQPLLPPASPSNSNPHPLRAVRDLRAMRAGALMFVDVVAEVPRTLSVGDASLVEEDIERVLKDARREIAEVRVKFHPVDPSDDHDAPRER